MLKNSHWCSCQYQFESKILRVEISLTESLDVFGRDVVSHQGQQSSLWLVFSVLSKHLVTPYGKGSEIDKWMSCMQHTSIALSVNRQLMLGYFEAGSPALSLPGHDPEGQHHTVPKLVARL